MSGVAPSSSSLSCPSSKTLTLAAAVSGTALAAGALCAYLLRSSASWRDGGIEYISMDGNLEEKLKASPLGDRDLLLALREEAIPYALCNGLVMRAAKGSSSFVHAPITLLPSQLPKHAFKQATEAAALFSKLVDKIARDKSYLEAVLSDVAEHDSYTKGLMDILKKTRQQERKQNITLGIFRSDYMLQKSLGPNSAYPKPIFLQVENNTIAASFGCLSTRVAAMHAYLVEHFMDHPKIVSAFPRKTDEERKNNSEVGFPKNAAISNFAEAIAEAIRAYKQNERIEKSRNVFVLMVVQAGEANMADQRLLEFALLRKHGIHTIRATFQEVADECKGRDMNGLPFAYQSKHIGVVYFRAGYTPQDFKTQNEWNAYEAIELSRAIKCPCISYHLAGTKKIQQKLNEAGELERFLTNEESKTLRLFFADQFSLSMPLDDGAERAVKDAITNPHLYVLKPQREGGGNNLWLDEMKQALLLKTMTADQRSAYILMRRIIQEPFLSALMQNGKVMVGECEKEVGIYATYIGGADRPYGKVAGHLMRTKLVGVNEGGVASGYAVLDSPNLVA